MAISESSTWIFRPQNAPPVERIVRFEDSKQNDEGQKSTLRLKNNTEFPVALKFRTNNIECYSVQPPERILQPNETCNFMVMLKPNCDVRKGDRLSLVTTFLENGESEESVDLRKLWKETDPKQLSIETIWLQARPSGLKLEVDEGTKMGSHLDGTNKRLVPFDSSNQLAHSRQKTTQRETKGEIGKPFHSHKHHNGLSTGTLACLIATVIVLLIIVMLILGLAYYVFNRFILECSSMSACYVNHPLLAPLICDY